MTASTPARVAVVTGAARGIGAATARLLSAQGYAVLAVDDCAGDGARRPASVPYPLATRAELTAVVEGLGENAAEVVADVTDADALARAVEVAQERWGRVDVAVAAAAVMTGGSALWETPAEELDTLWRTDVLGVWNLAAACVPRMLAGPAPAGCRFVAVSSAAGENGLFRMAAYSTVKHAVVGMMRGLAADLVGTGVTAVTVSPGSTRTTMLDATAQVYGLASPEEFAEHSLLRRLLEPEEVAATIVFCCSAAGAPLHGSIVRADGGFVG